jgi:hypothetical protein
VAGRWPLLPVAGLLFGGVLKLFIFVYIFTGQISYILIKKANLFLIIIKVFVFGIQIATIILSRSIVNGQ